MRLEKRGGPGDRFVITSIGSADAQVVITTIGPGDHVRSVRSGLTPKVRLTPKAITIGPADAQVVITDHDDRSG